MSVDPALAETDQPYAYAGDDPVNEGDPSGLMVQPAGEDPFTNYANDTDLLIEWALGIQTNQYFDQQSPLTQSLMNDPHQNDVIAQIQRDLAIGRYQDEYDYTRVLVRRGRRPHFLGRSQLYGPQLTAGPVIRLWL